MDILTTSELTAPIAKDNRTLNEQNQAFMTNNCAAKVSNLDSNDIEIDADKDEKGRNFDEFALFVRDNSTPATKFSNVQYDDATKNGILMICIILYQKLILQPISQLVMKISTNLLKTI